LQINKCKECGKENPIAEMFCRGCGKSFVGETSAVVEKQTVAIPSVFIKNRSFGLMLVFSFITYFLYPGFFIKEFAKT
jgi:uncharacterized membrane protein YvbJ